jgi:hypothetical protein
LNIIVQVIMSRGNTTRMRTALLAALLVVTACHRGRPAAVAPGQPPPPTPMPPPVELYYDAGGGVRDSMRVVMRDAATLANYWQQATSTQPTPPPVPAIDFTREMVILVAAGRMTPEDQIHVDSLLARRELTAAGDRPETLSIVVRTVIGCGRFRAEAFPVNIVKARKFDGPVKWVEKVERVTCENPAAQEP